MKKLILLLSTVVLNLTLIAQSEIPINTQTKLVSVNKVVELKNKELSVKDIHDIADRFITTYQSANTTKPPYSKKDKDKMPNFLARKTLNQDSIVIYDMTMVLDYFHSGGMMSTSSLTGGDIVQFRLQLFIKQGRFKYDFTSFVHNYAHKEHYKGVSGGKFENEFPQESGSLINKKKSEWLEIKRDVILLVRNIARELEKAYENQSNSSQFNF